MCSSQGRQLHKLLLLSLLKAFRHSMMTESKIYSSKLEQGVTGFRTSFGVIFLKMV